MQHLYGIFKNKPGVVNAFLDKQRKDQVMGKSRMLYHYAICLVLLKILISYFLYIVDLGTTWWLEALTPCTVKNIHIMLDSPQT